MKQELNNIAFTLVELLVVIAIVGILSGLIIVGMNSSTNSAKVAKAQIFSNSLRNSLLMNLISEWKFDGDTNDNWGTNNGTSLGTTIATSGCVYGSCLSLTGVSQYVDFGNSSSLLDVFNNGAAFTYSIWFYPTAIPSSWNWIVCKAFTSHVSPYYQTDLIFYQGAYIQSRVINNAGSSYIPNAGSSAGSISLNTWNLATVSVDLINNTNKLYLNGSLVSSTSGASGTYTNYTTPLAIGADRNIYNSTSYNFIGKMDEFRLYNAAVPTSLIKEQYYTGLNKILAKKEINGQEYQNRLVGIE